jgi:hypothetical protein
LRPILLLLLSNVALFGQAFSVGVKGGVRATDDYEQAAESQSRRCVVGPVANLALPYGFGIESRFPPHQPHHLHAVLFQRENELADTHGVVAGGGGAIPAGRIEFSPELRCTHWNREAVSGNFPDSEGLRVYPESN